MINLDAKYESYLHTNKCFQINGQCEKVTGYGWTDDGTKIDGYYVLTNNYKLFYNLKEEFQRMEELITTWKSGRVV